MIFDNSDIVKGAEAIAARDGGSWADHLDTARHEARQPALQKVVQRSDPLKEALSKKAVVAQQRRLPGTGNPDPDRRLEIGECETELGRVRVSISRDSISIHGVNTPLSEIDTDLRGAVATTAASFAAAETALEQTEQRAVIGVLMDAILRRHQFLTASVKEAKTRERYDN
jgi:hypothetical protein